MSQQNGYHQRKRRRRGNRRSRGALIVEPTHVIAPVSVNAQDIVEIIQEAVTPDPVIIQTIAAIAKQRKATVRMRQRIELTVEE